MKMLIAEIGVNWNTIMQFESMLVELSEMGVEYAKGQLFTEEYLDGRLKDQVLDYDTAKHLMEFAEGLGICLFWTPSEDATVDLCISLKPKFIKIAHTHFDNQDMANTMIENEAMCIVSVPALTQDVVALWPMNTKYLTCVNMYPPPKEGLLLFDYDVDYYHGVSLHSDLLTPYLNSAQMGADIIEVHVKQNDDCIDSAVSLSMEEFAILKRELDFIWG